MSSFEEHNEKGEQRKRLPPWFKIRITTNDRFLDVRKLIQSRKLHTVCQSAACPNQKECWNAGTATFMILGNICSRWCRFCNVPKGSPAGIDAEEPERIADAVLSLQLRYAVITSVTRDDLADGGADIFAQTIQAIRSKLPGCRIEVLIPDFLGSFTSLRVVLDAKPDVLNHNVETVPSLYPSVRPQAVYQRSLDLLSNAKSCGAVTKTGIMLGLGEREDEISAVLHDLISVKCDILTIGQYLQPGHNHLPVKKYYKPEDFFRFRDQALSMGFSRVDAGPLVRSSYHAEQNGALLTAMT